MSEEEPDSDSIASEDHPNIDYEFAGLLVDEAIVIGNLLFDHWQGGWGRNLPKLTEWNAETFRRIDPHGYSLFRTKVNSAAGEMVGPAHLFNEYLNLDNIYRNMHDLPQGAGNIVYNDKTQSRELTGRLLRGFEFIQEKYPALLLRCFALRSCPVEVLKGIDYLRSYDHATDDFANAPELFAGLYNDLEGLVEDEAYANREYSDYDPSQDDNDPGLGSEEDSDDETPPRQLRRPKTPSAPRKRQPSPDDFLEGESDA